VELKEIWEEAVVTCYSAQSWRFLIITEEDHVNVRIFGAPFRGSLNSRKQE
jgi:hypothetical protein